MTHSRQACAATYADVEPLIFRLVNRFVDRYNYDYDEALGIARLAYMQAYCSYDYKVAAFTTWLWWKVWSRLMDAKKRDARRAAKTRFLSIDVENQNRTGMVRDSIPERKSFDRQTLVDRLGPEGKLVMRMVLDSPGALRSAFGIRETRKVLRRRLLDMGWIPAEVRRVFAEVRTVMGWSVSQSSKWCREVAKELQVDITTTPPDLFPIDHPKPRHEPKISVNAVCRADLIGTIIETRLRSKMSVVPIM